MTEDDCFVIIEDDVEKELYFGRPMTEAEKELKKEETKDFGGYEDK